MVDWFRRRTGKDETSNGATTVETERPKTCGPYAAGGEPADGFSEAGIREALRDVRDPEIGRDLVSLNMIRGIEIEGPSVTVGVALTTAGCPLKHRITTDIKDRLHDDRGRRGRRGGLRRDDRRGPPEPADLAARRPLGARPRLPRRVEDPHHRRRERQGRRGQEHRRREPGRRARPGRALGGDPRRRRARLLDPRHARVARQAERGRTASSSP